MRTGVNGTNSVAQASVRTPVARVSRRPNDAARARNAPVVFSWTYAAPAAPYIMTRGDTRQQGVAGHEIESAA
jgi:hypothetical protein